MLVFWKTGHHQLLAPEISLIQPSLPHPVAPPRPSRSERTPGRWTKPSHSTSFGLRDRGGKQKTYCLCIPAPIQVRCKELEMQHPPKAQTPTRALRRKTQPTACRSNFKAYLNSSLQEATGSSRLHAPHQFTELQGINKPQGNVLVPRAPDK